MGFSRAKGYASRLFRAKGTQALISMLGTVLPLCKKNYAAPTELDSETSPSPRSPSYGAPLKWRSTVVTQTLAFFSQYVLSEFLLAQDRVESGNISFPAFGLI
jgi:hypothetical protein